MSNKLFSQSIKTLLGAMIAISDEHKLLLLEFMERKKLKEHIEALKKERQTSVEPKKSFPLESIQREIKEYFQGGRTFFETPVEMMGTAFQRKVWKELLSIPLGTTLTYQAIAKQIGNPKSVRAVANAIGANQLAILIPCHRVIRSDKTLGGYAAGLGKKNYLIDLEKLPV